MVTTVRNFTGNCSVSRFTRGHGVDCSQTKIFSRPAFVFALVFCFAVVLHFMFISRILWQRWLCWDHWKRYSELSKWTDLIVASTDRSMRLKVFKVLFNKVVNFTHLLTRMISALVKLWQVWITKKEVALTMLNGRKCKADKYTVM